MGIDPTSPTYFEGAPCNQCKDLIFSDMTPQFVLAVVSGVVTCPGGPAFDANGAHYLTQNELEPCLWFKLDGVFDWEWRLSLGVSTFSIHLLGDQHYFFDHNVNPCATAFQNEQVDCGGDNLGKFGVVKIFWGPGIGP